MITPAVRTAVSRPFHIVAIAMTVVLGACAAGARPAVWDASEVVPARPVTVRFDNEASQWVDVYLVGERRAWRLGRVVPGANVKLEIPEGAITDGVGFVRLAVIEGGSISVDAAHDPRARFGIPQPIGDLPRQRFAFTERQAGGAQLIALQADRIRR